MRFTNPDGTLRLRLATSRATPSWSRSGFGFSNGSLSRRSMEKAFADNGDHLKRFAVCKCALLLVSIPSLFFKASNGVPEVEACGVREAMSQRALQRWGERLSLGLEEQMT